MGVFVYTSDGVAMSDPFSAIAPAAVAIVMQLPS